VRINSQALVRLSGPLIVTSPELATPISIELDQALHGMSDLALRGPQTARLGMTSPASPRPSRIFVSFPGITIDGAKAATRTIALTRHQRSGMVALCK